MPKMIMPKSETLDIKCLEDIVRTRQTVRSATIEMGFSLIVQTKFMTAASELARNTFLYGGGGSVTITPVNNGKRSGLKLVFRDKGPGIADIEQALTDGFTTGNGLGLGLGGARRLANEFEIDSEPGKGTMVAITRWK